MHPEEPLFLRACRSQTVSRPPVWIMRQAGRYLPEYRAVREKADFLTLCRTPELSCEVTLQPLRRFALDAAIVFSDIMMPLESMGIELQFNPGPVVMRPIRDAAAVRALRVPESGEIAPYVMETIRLLRTHLKVPLIGFAGAPLTLAAYLVEGKGSKDFSLLRSFMAASPTDAHALFDVLAKSTARYLTAQVQAGAQAVQLFDSWAGILNERTYRTFALPAVQYIMQALKPLNVPRIYFAQDAAHLWPAVAEVDAEVWGVDWRTELKTARAGLRAGAVVQGNLDPAILCSSPEAVKAAARQVLDSGKGGPHIFNLGHGILPHTPIANVEALMSVVT